jgi:hypothetical protein
MIIYKLTLPSPPLIVSFFVLDEADFTPVQGSLNFSAGFGSSAVERRKCFSFDITDDELPEAAESFMLTLHQQEEQSRIMLEPNMTRVYISNDDGMIH